MSNYKRKNEPQTHIKNYDIFGYREEKAKTIAKYRELKVA